MISFDSCSYGTLTVHAAEDTLTEELATAFQEEVQTGEEKNVETEIPVEERTAEPAEEQIPEEPEETVSEPEPMKIAGNSFSLESQEYQILLKIVEAEAGGEDTIGKMLVANVVMNRVRSSHFPNSVTEVVYQRHNGKAQFSPTADGRIDRVNVSADTIEAVARAMNGEDPSAGATYFKSVRSKSGWHDRALNRVMQYGNHIFYTL
ncbi:MAG: cell wall hydrolase [Lachnospiraceae bacterium]|nr:cell wall hydrolase [Lachnospiraceae bacterium]